MPSPDTASPPRPTLARGMGVLGLTATGVCAMVGAGINIIPFMIQRNVPGIGPYVLAAFALAALPAILAGLAYATLASAMPRAGGSYLYASRGLNPYLGFVASFSQWFALSVAIGVVSYVLVPFIRDIDAARGLAADVRVAEDGIFPKAIAAVHPRYLTPHVAVADSGGMASLGILDSHLAGDFFLGVDILVTAMLVNFVLMALSVLALPSRNPALAREVTVLPDRRLQATLAALGVVVLTGFLVVHTWKDLTAPVEAWYFRSTWLWLVVMAAGSLVYWREVSAMRRRGVDLDARFAALPPE